MNVLHEFDTDVFGLVRSYEGTRFVENLALERVTKDVDYFELSKGTKFDPWSNPSPSLIFVVEGQVTVTIPDSISSSPRHASLQPKGQAVSKTLKRGACLNPTSHILAILSRQENGLDDEPILPRFGEARVLYEAATDLKLCRVNLGQSGSISEDVRSPMIQGLLQKLFLVTLPVSEMHFGLRDQVLECEAKMASLHSTSVYENPFNDAAPSKVYYEENILESPAISSRGGTPDPYDDKPTRRRAPSNLSTASTLRPQSMLGSELYKEAQLPLMKSRSNPNLRLMINTEKVQNTATDDSKLGVFKSQSILSKTERKRQSIPHFEVKTPDNRRIRAQTAERMYNMLMHPKGFNVRNSLYVDRAIMDEIESNIEVLSFGQGEYIAHKGERYPGVCLVIDGGIEACAGNRISPQSIKMLPFKVGPGDIIGHSSLVHNNKSQFDFRAIQRSTVGLMPRTFLRRLTDLCPQISVVLAAKMHDCLPPLVSLIDFALDWSTVKAGGEIYKKGDNSDSICFVVRGRVRITEKGPSDMDAHIKEYGPGNPFGVLEFHTNRPRSCTAHAIRKSEIAKLQKASYQKLVNYAPDLGSRLWHSIAQGPQGHQQSTEAPDSTRLRTIAVFPLSLEVPAAKCAGLLSSALVRLGIYEKDGVSLVESHRVISAVGSTVFTDAGNKHLEDYVGHVEQNSDLTILIGEHSVDSTWNDICIATADLIILMAMDDCDPRITPVELKLERHGTMAQKILVLVDDGEADFCPQAITRPYIQERSWLSEATSHIERTRLTSIDSCKDFERLARRITGRSIAVVFGGGGARGFAHLGTLQALEEEGIPFDIVGGTSMGAFVGALYASHMSIDRTVEAAKAFSKVSRWYRYLLDFTMPILAWTSGSSFTNHVSSAMDQDLDSSDLRLAFYCNATNMSQGGQSLTMYPQARSLWQMVRASMSIPPIFPPFAVEGEGDILVDGCFSANVPVFPALSMGAEIVLAFDVSNMGGAPPPQTLGQSVSGWYNLAQMIFPCASSRKPHKSSPYSAVGTDGNVWGSLQLLELITFSTNTNEIKAIQNTPQCLYMLHDLDKIGTFDMEKFESIREMGYEGAKKWLRELKTSGKLDHLALPRGIKDGDR
ncbi:lysophospholipase nte1 [Fusarium flagelliforme]|uniref:Lysophospholipase NTE1 n=1 Tax=Fusarium flagelliforme TaxID=2675880 RepID=A0A395MMJ3_9HYPO|nr:lysophospholipase nte1 [Fusarium flagelliforme]